ncbi:MAG TPA: hypothetical protein DDZ53_11260 [Firmicutes bacterium]|jgi:hypothetical protein|nr:hypothetical protein [Bacillota bacterium]
MKQDYRYRPKVNRAHNDLEDEQRRITWREFLLLCGAMYRQVLPGMLLLAGAIVLAIMLLT